MFKPSIGFPKNDPPGNLWRLVWEWEESTRSLMTNYKNLRNHCPHTQHLMSAVIEDFLINYAAHQEKLHKKAKKETDPVQTCIEGSAAEMV